MGFRSERRVTECSVNEYMNKMDECLTIKLIKYSSLSSPPFSHFLVYFIEIIQMEK